MMKRIVILVIVCIVMLAGCGSDDNVNTSSTNQTENDKKEESAGVSDEAVKAAVEKIDVAKNAVKNCASYQLEGWSKYSDVTNYYFDDNAYQDASESGIKARATKAHDERMSANRNMDEAKELLGTNGDSEYYKAAKNYYLAVDKFLSLVSTFPAGYSKLTFSQAVKDAIDDVETAYGEVSFYQ